MDALSATEPIRAAGGVVTRTGPDGLLRVVLVHRPRHNDWTLPKGKLHRGEHPVTAARREVAEETGILARVGARLPSVSYQVALNLAPDAPTAEKVVDFWAMRCDVDGGFVPGAETDELAWLPLDEARSRVSYERDAYVLDAFAALPPMRDPVVLVRHASAGDSDGWTGDDLLRPLDQAGVARAREIVEPLSCFAPVRLVSAAPLRCVQTLTPLGTSLGLAVEVDPAFDEEADPPRVQARLRELSALAGATVICSQGKVIPAVLAALTGGQTSSYPTPKGAAWVLSFDAEGGLKVDPLP